MTAYQKRLTSDDEVLSLEAARRWSIWEESTNRLIQDPEGIAKAQTDDKWSRSVHSHECYHVAHTLRAFARIENHYFVNKVSWPTLQSRGQLIDRVFSPKMVT